MVKDDGRLARRVISDDFRAGAPSGYRRFAQNTVFGLVLLAAAVLRLWGIGDRLPDPTLGISPLDDSAVEESDRTEVYRAWAMWEGGTKPISLDPGTVGWPSVSFYLTLGVQLTYRLCWSMLHGSADGAAFALHFAEQPQGIFLSGRFLGVLIGLFSIWLLHWVALRVTTESAATLGAIFLALNPLHIQASQRVADPNLLAGCFTLLLAAPLIRTAVEPNLKPVVLSAVFIGLAAGSKYVPVVFVAVLLTQIFVHYRATGTPEVKRFILRAAVAILVTVTTFVLTSPYVVLRGPESWAEIQSQRTALTADWVGQATGGFALPDYLSRVLPSALTWPIYALAVGGLALLWRRDQGGRVIAILPVLLILALGLLGVAQERYLLPCLPFLLLGAAVGIDRATGLVHRNAHWNLNGLRTGLTAALLVLPTAQILGYRSEMAKADSRHGARRWILENLAPGDPIAIELYGPVLNSGRIERLAITWPFYSSQAASVGIAYHPEFLEGIRYYALSGEVRRRFEAEAERYPNEVAHYRWLDGNAVSVWGSRAERFGGPEIRILSLPPGVRPRAIRDSIWAGNSLVGADSSRLTRWCGDLATIGAATGRLDLAEEWATRGAGLAEGSMRLRLLGMAGEAILRQGRFEHAVRFLERVREDYPTTLEIRILLALALTESGRPWEALAEYRTALSLAPDSAQRTAIRSEMEKLSSLRTPSDSR